jgi:3'-phosphoadenosine 5'-phosphosulfate (PAPS) 3'-phosphatase
LLFILFILKIVSEEKDPVDNEQFQLIKEEFYVETKSPDIPFIQNDEAFMTVPLSSVAVWIDPLDATKEFTGLIYISYIH